MVVLTFLKFLKSNSNTSSKLAATTTIYSQSVLQSTTFNHHLSDDTDDDYDDDDDDSFFELELSSPSQQPLNQTEQPHDHDDNDNDNDDHDHDDNDDDEIKMHKKPQSPMSVLRGASPNLFKNVMIMMMKKKNSRVEDFADTDSVSSSLYSPKRISNDSDSNFNSDSSFTVKFKIEDGSIVPKLTRSHSSNSNSNSNTFTSPKLENRNVSFYEISKRFSKDTVQKYLKNIIKPKSNSKNYRNGENKNGSALPLMKEKEEKQSTSRFKVKCKQLGKCKSASAVIGVSSPSSFPVRNDFPADGIEGAILHCKRSLTSSIKGYSSLSRCSSDPSYEKSIQVAEVRR